MNRTITIVLVLIVAGAVAFFATRQSNEGNNRLHVYNWSDYIAPETIEKFEAETGISVTYDIFESNEVLDAKMRAGSSGYDVVFPSDIWLKRGYEAGAYQKLDPAKLPNARHQDSTIQGWSDTVLGTADLGMVYMWGTVGIGYNADMVAARLGDDFPRDSWALMLEPQYASRLEDCGLLVIDAPVDILTNVLAYTGRDPRSVETADLEAAGDALMRIRPYIRKVDAVQHINDLANGDICAGMVWSGDAFQAAYNAEEAGNGQTIEYILPKEGSLLWFDIMAIPVDAPNPDNAHRFIDFMMRPEIAAENANFVWYASGSAGSREFTDPDLLGNPAIYPDEATMRNLYVAPPYPAATDRVLTRVWSRFVAGN